MSYRWILFDADGTLFDYERAEAAALAEAWRTTGLPAPTDLLAVYRRVNGALWRRFERGEVEQREIPLGRFRDLFAELRLDREPEPLADAYLAALARQTHLLDGALELLRELSASHRLGLVTNGLAEVQRPRLARSPLPPFFEVVVISGEIGYAKPDPRFFDAAFERMGKPPRHEVLMVGDGLESDVRGAERYGLDCVWLASPDLLPGARRPTYRIHRLAELRAIVAPGADR